MGSTIEHSAASLVFNCSLFIFKFKGKKREWLSEKKNQGY
jgi:hypothetical protein